MADEEVIIDDAFSPSPSTQSTHWEGDDVTLLAIAGLEEEEESRERMDAGPEVTSRKRPAEDDGDRPKKFYRPSQDSDKTLNAEDSPIPSAHISPHPNHPCEPAVPLHGCDSRPPAVSTTPIEVAKISHYTFKWFQRLPWGAQWEIVRYVSTGFPSEHFTIQTLERLRQLNVNAKAAPEVTRHVESIRGHKENLTNSGQNEFSNAYAREHFATLPWDELDKEEAILQSDVYGALGCCPEDTLDSDPGWYGGKVNFTAKLGIVKGKGKGKDRGSYDGDNPFYIHLDRPQLGPSNRFMRRFGSHRFIRVRIQKDALKQKGTALTEYFQHPFIVGSSVFRAFFAKEHNVFLFKTNEVVEGRGKVAPGPATNGNISLMDFIRWHNDLNLNKNQTMAKWAARFALGLSNSVPGIRLDHQNVLFMDDIVCDAFKGPGQPPSEMQMTDGCGFANRKVMQLLYDRYPTWDHMPTAIQCRIGGAKGLLLVRHDLPPEEELEPKVWLRPSQTKIKYTSQPLDVCLLPGDTDPAQLTLDVLRASHMRCPARLSVETITNFAENGVPPERFKELFKMNLTERLNALLGWDCAPDRPDQPETMKLLWAALAREGGVMAARLAREDAGRARVAGYVFEDREEDLDDEDGLGELDEALKDQSNAWWADDVSGCPSSLEETCMTLLAGGFTPQTCPVLKAKLSEVAKKVVKTFKTKYRFAVPMSCSAFIVPDPYGVLGPNEIHVKSSRSNLPDEQGRLNTFVVGDVLVTRHPCKVPSDVQKVRAVQHDKLSHYCDVIVISTASHMYQGSPLNRHLASLTGGGDYDGDTMEVFWDPVIVRTFQTPDPRVFAVEPESVRDALTKSTESVTEFLSRVPTTSADVDMIYALQKYLLGSLQDKSLVGQYSVWWENSTYHNGYDHEETIFLAYMFCAILDGSKTGVTVKPDVYKQHVRNKVWQSRAPEWKEAMEDRKSLPDAGLGNRVNLKRGKGLRRFVMDRLHDDVSHACGLATTRINEKFTQAYPVQPDMDLEEPHKNARKRAEALEGVGVDGMKRELVRIEEHVRKMAERSKNEATGQAFTERPIEERQDILRDISRAFHGAPTGLLHFSREEARCVKASYAYRYDREHSGSKGWSRFPWNVAMRELCAIKAEALKWPMTVCQDFHEYMVLSPAYLRKYSGKV